MSKNFKKDNKVDRHKITRSVNNPIKLTLFSIGLAIFGTVALLSLTNFIGQQYKESIGLYFLYQILSLGVALIIIGAMYRAKKGKLTYLSIGNMNAPTRPIKLLGVKKTDSWRTVGITFAIIITLVTGTFLYVGYGNGLADIQPVVWVWALLLALPLSAINALNEELITRWVVVEGMIGKYARYAPWVSALIFGSVHFFGIPGGFIGSLMAGFLAWLLARSIQETRGIGWAWCIHFCQDILIFTVTIALFL